VHSPEKRNTKKEPKKNKKKASQDCQNHSSPSQGKAIPQGGSTQIFE
jgi:hypothetical protein